WDAPAGRGHRAAVPARLPQLRGRVRRACPELHLALPSCSSSREVIAVLVAKLTALAARSAAGVRGRQRSCGGRTSRRTILPVGPFGRSGMSQTWRGYLYGATRSLTNDRSSAGVAGAPRLWVPGGPDFLAQFPLRDSDHRGLGDGGMLVEDLFALARVHVVPAADDQVLLPVDDEEVAILIDPGQVTGTEPAVGDGLGGGVRAAPVPL